MTTDCLAAPYDERCSRAMLLLDGQHRVVAMDAAFGSWFSCAEEAVVGRGFDELVSPLDRSGLAAYYAGMTGARDAELDLLLTLRVTDGDQLVRVTIMPRGSDRLAFLELAQPGGLLHELAQAQEWWRTVVREAADGIGILDPEGRVLEHNPRFLELLAFRTEHGVPLTEDSVKGKSLLDIFASEAFAPLRSALEAAKPRNRRFVGTVPHARRWLHLELTPSFSAGRRHRGYSLLVRDRTAEEELARAREESAHAAGMAEIATGVLHNAGNVLNSVNVSATVVGDRLHKLRLDGLQKLTSLLTEQGEGLGRFLTEDPRGKLVPNFLRELTAQLVTERQELIGELSTLRRRVDHLKQVISAQQSYARGTRSVEVMPLAEAVDAAIAIAIGELTDSGLLVERDYATLPAFPIDRHRVLQVLINVLRNAKQALVAAAPAEKRLSVRIAPVNGSRAAITVTDNGPGIAPEHAAQLFQYGFTTKAEGHGFGLHASAAAAREMGGELTCTSPGLGLGASFTLELPTNATPE